MDILREKTAVVTGGARGIGRAVAIKLAEAGCNLAIGYYNSSDAAEDLAATIRSQGRETAAYRVNVADEASVAEFAAAVTDKFGSIDILVSNAASGVLKPALEMSVKHWRWCMETNALALNHLVKSFRDAMPQGSRVIALSSLGAQRAIPNYAFIGASKAALEAMVRSLALELAPAGIAVNAVSAGVVDTDALKYFPNREQLLDEYMQGSLAGRELTVEDVADAVYLLCLRESWMIRGHTLVVDAGYSVVG